MYVVSSLDSGLKQLIASGLVELAILPRYLPPEPTDDEPITRRDWFDRLYTVATLANVDDLP